MPPRTKLQELIFSKVALEWDEEKISGAALSEMIHNPETEGSKQSDWVLGTRTPALGGNVRPTLDYGVLEAILDELGSPLLYAKHQIRVVHNHTSRILSQTIN